MIGRLLGARISCYERSDEVKPIESKSPNRRSLWRHASRVARALLALVVLLLLSGIRTDFSLDELRPRYAGGASRFAMVDGVSVHYRDEGVGPPLVLLHGTSSSLHTWDRWVERLSPQRRIVRLDLPGFGLTGPAGDRDYSAARFARVVVALLDQLGISRADFAGNSLGGRVALTIALDHPSYVRRLVLLAPAGLSGQRLPKIFRLARTPVLNRLLRWVTPRMVVRGNLNEVYGDPSRVTDALVDRYYELTRREGNRQAIIDRFSNLSDPDLDPRLREIHVPVLLEWGERDVWIPLAFADRFRAGIVDSKLVTYPGVGHVPMEEHPEATAGDADRFLAAADGAP
jgi:pimeloyl-ACP methyl ester carboxylesterase